VIAAVISCAAVVCGISVIIAWRARSAARADRLALRLAREREAAFIECARALAHAAAVSIDAVREEVDRAVRAIAPQIDTVALFEEDAAQLRCVRATGARIDYFEGMRLALDDPHALAVRALARGHRVVLGSEPGAAPLHPSDAFAAAIPLALDAGRTCVLSIGARTAVADGTLDRIVTVVDQAAPAYRIARSREDDRQRAEYDGLTGLLSARAFRERFSAMIERARYSPQARIAVLFVDTDRFKVWNDTFGHASGDALLRELARLLRSAAGEPGDFAARNGGDEFCVVFAECEKSRAVERAQRLCETIAAADFTALRPVGAAGDVRISASIGVAAFPADEANAAALLEHADAAMYHSKRTGRNAVSYTGVDGALARLGAPASAAP
jgi:diguanylate cyclase (GGDEF)-like protein